MPRTVRPHARWREVHSPLCDRANGPMPLPCFVDEKGCCFTCGRNVRLEKPEPKPPVDLSRHSTVSPTHSNATYWVMVVLVLALVIEVLILGRR